MSDKQPPGSTAAAPPGQTKRRSFVRRHLVLVLVGAFLLLAAGAAGGYLYWVNSQFEKIDKVDAGILPRPPEVNYKESEQPLNILLLGADQPEDAASSGEKFQSVADELKDGKWTPFSHRSDTIMVAHIPADRKSVQLVSIPRDTWTRIDGYPADQGYGKINAAFAYGGPKLAVKTVQELTGLRIDHLAIIDWAGFKDLTTAIDGVRVYIPEAFYDTSQRISWEQGWQELEGQLALAYVRTRYNLPDESGDFGRIDRQQNFIRATMSKLLSSGTVRNPIKLTKVINVITSNLTVDDTWDNEDIRNLAWSMRSLRTDDVEFLTAPLGKYDMVGEQSIIRLAPKQSKDLFTALQDDAIDSYLKKYPKEQLDDDKSIN
ncbi:MAG: LCP family protein [Nocardioidaceae bacterium]